MKALILVDLQNDFMPGGALAVKDGQRILPVICDLLKKPWDLIVASKDWHPEGHISFASRHGKGIGEKIVTTSGEQILWPDHCIQESPGADFCPGWDFNKVDKVFYKGIDPEVDSYSAFFDNRHARETGLYRFLKEKGIDHVYLAGLTTEYCVKYSAQDAHQLGLNVTVIEDGVMGVNLKPEDASNALREMKSQGIQVISAKEV